MNNAMKKLFGLILFVPVVLNAQTSTRMEGIRFERDLGWEQILAKAKEENKYIFVDCYASWCLPCKKMDKEIYSDHLVGNYLNDNFISLKLQMDTSANDDENVKAGYADSHRIMQEYRITAFPSYLFFSPGGKIVHRDLGYKKTDDFIDLAKKATDPTKQYYTLLEKYQQGKKDYSILPYLATTARSLNEKKLANGIAQEYINNYLLTLSEKEIFTKKNIQFIVSFIQTAEDKSFHLFYPDGQKVDSVMEE